MVREKYEKGKINGKNGATYFLMIVEMKSHITQKYVGMGCPVAYDLLLLLFIIVHLFE